MGTRIFSALARETGASAATGIIAQLSASLEGAEPALVLVFASTKQPLTDIMPPIAARFPTAVVLGASTAGEFTERGDAKGAAVAVAIVGDYKVFAGMGANLRASPEQAVAAAVEKLPRSLPGYAHRTAILLLDPLAGGSEEVTLLVASALGEDTPMAGGAAGDDLRMKETFVALGGRAATDAIVVAEVFSKAPLGLGVCHGHRALSEPLRVTLAEGSLVREIEGRPAWDVWREKTRESAARRGIDTANIAPDKEGAYLLQYEAGLASGDGLKIRAPLSRTGGAIQFACEVPTGVVFRITESDASAQVSSAREAAKRAMSGLGGSPAAGAIVFDCICRNLILDKEFNSAVSGIVEELGNVPVAGFETYGEIAMAAGDMSGFHNTTSVVLAFPK